MTTLSLDLFKILYSSDTATADKTNLQKSKPFERSTILLLLICFCFTTFAVLHTQTRNSLRGIFLKDFREVLATASGDLANDGGQFQVVKIKTRDAISLEVYELSASGVQRMVDRYVLSDRRDAHFNFNGVQSNLVIEDFNHDGALEIVAPTFDNDFVGHLNVLKFNAATKSFEKLAI